MNDTSTSQPQLSAVPSPSTSTTQSGLSAVHPATNIDVKSAVTLGALKTIGALVVVIFLGGWGAYAGVALTSKAQVDAGLAPYDQKLAAEHENVKAIAERLDQHIKDEAASRDEDRTDRKSIHSEVQGLREDLRRVFPTLPPLPPKDAGGQ